MGYFPNGIAGTKLCEQCAHCPLGDQPCVVYVAQITYNSKQHDEGQDLLKEALNLLIDDEGTCLLKRQVVIAVQEANGEKAQLRIPMTEIPD